MSASEHRFIGNLENVKIKGEGIDTSVELKLVLAFKQMATGKKDATPIDVTWLGQQVGRSVQVTLMGWQSDLPLFPEKPTDGQA